jgi:hypothetical protein
MPFTGGRMSRHKKTRSITYLSIIWIFRSPWLLRKLEGRRGRISQMGKEMRRIRGMIYQHPKEHKDYGYLNMIIL